VGCGGAGAGGGPYGGSDGAGTAVGMASLGQQQMAPAAPPPMHGHSDALATHAAVVEGAAAPMGALALARAADATPTVDISTPSRHPAAMGALPVAVAACSGVGAGPPPLASASMSQAAALATAEPNAEPMTARGPVPDVGPVPRQESALLRCGWSPPTNGIATEQTASPSPDAWSTQPAFMLPEALPEASSSELPTAASGLLAYGYGADLTERHAAPCGGALFGVGCSPSAPAAHWPTVRQAFAPSTASLLPADQASRQSLAEETSVQQQRLEQMRASMRAVKRQQLGHNTSQPSTPPPPTTTTTYPPR